MATAKQLQKHESSYTFTSEPKTLYTQPKYRPNAESYAPHPSGTDAHYKGASYYDTHTQKYRNNEAQPQRCYVNLMHDPHIVRGNTYAHQTIPVEQEATSIQQKFQRRRKAAAKERILERQKQFSPPLDSSLRNMCVQTEMYLEALTDRIEEADAATQSDAFLDRPQTPLFIPACTGVPVETQIYPGDLFDFDLEVKPILEVLVGKTIEQAMLEVLNEEELYNLRQQQRYFEELRNAELVEMQRLEEEERRHNEEKRRRIKQQKEALLKEQETAQKIAAHAFTQSYLSELIESVFLNLRISGYLFDPIERDIEVEFLPGLLNSVSTSIANRVTIRTVLDEIIRNVTNKRLDDYEEAFQLEEEEQEQENLKEFGEEEKEKREPVKPPVVKFQDIVEEENQEEEEQEKDMTLDLEEEEQEEGETLQVPPPNNESESNE